jgi:hypothetical protein
MFEISHPPAKHGEILPDKNNLEIAQMTDKEPIEMTVHVPLNAQPGKTWVDCFYKPTEHAGSFPPQKVKITGNSMEFRTAETEMRNDLSWTYKYIDQANAAYKKAIAAQTQNQATQFEKEGKLQQKRLKLTEELRKV